MPKEEQVTDYNSCVHDEQATKDKLTKEWASYPAAARSECVSDRSSLVNSYVELLTCIEMQRWKSDPAMMNPGGSGGATTFGGAIGGSPPSPGQLGSSLATHPLGGRPGAHLP